VRSRFKIVMPFAVVGLVASVAFFLIALWVLGNPNYFGGGVIFGGIFTFVVLKTIFLADGTFMSYLVVLEQTLLPVTAMLCTSNVPIIMEGHLSPGPVLSGSLRAIGNNVNIEMNPNGVLRVPLPLRQADLRIAPPRRQNGAENQPLRRVQTS
jgi:hypothetical protein